jgi:GNAT superfamily N-acetyltransferase
VSLNPGISLRTHRPGDLGWIVSRHGALYAQEYGWDHTFEALVASIAADFLNHYDAARERCWIAELDRQPVGSVMLVNDRAGGGASAKLRLLLVEPSARGHGIGELLVKECIGFARAAGYRTLNLWTQANLHAARRIYQRVGFTLAAEEPARRFGHDLVSQTWTLPLR